MNRSDIVPGMGKVKQKKAGCLVAMRRWLFRLAAVVALVVLLAVGAGAVYFRGPLYNRLVAFPRQAAAWKAIQAQRQETQLDDGWTEYRGSLHNHSHFSHDSEAEFEEILAACKENELEFIFMSDHCVDGKADYSLQWKGDHGGVTFVRGFEMKEGFMPWGLPDDTVLDCGADPLALAAEIEERGGVLFYAHSEEDRIWDLPQLTGMEIYNIHTDVKDEDLKALMPDIVFNIGAYPDQTYRLLFDRQTAILEHWDQLNRDRRIVGIAANDVHQNTGLRAYWTQNGTLLLRERGPKDIGEYELGWFRKGLLWLFLGPLEPGRELLCFTIDKYPLGLRFVNTHILARDRTEQRLIDGLRQGRVFIAFDMLADARGFTYLAEGPGGRAVMGEEIAYAPDMALRAESPLPCRFTLKLDGVEVTQGTGRTFEHAVGGPGNYRIEAELEILDVWTPWVYTNPIRVIEPSAEAPSSPDAGLEAAA